LATVHEPHRQDRTDRQRTDSIGRTVLQTVAQKWFTLCCRTVVCPVLSVSRSCPVCNVGVLWPNGWLDQDETWHAGRPRPGYMVLDGDPVVRYWVDLQSGHGLHCCSNVTQCLVCIIIAL